MVAWFLHVTFDLKVDDPGLYATSFCFPRQETFTNIFSLHLGVQMGTEGDPVMDLYPVQVGVLIPLVASCYGLRFFPLFYLMRYPKLD